MSSNVTAKFYVADDIRQESSGKHTLVGLYTNDVIVLTAGDESTEVVVSKERPAVIRVAFMMCFIGLSKGTREAKLTIVDPEGHRTGSPITVSVTTAGNDSATNLTLFAPAFPVRAFGTFKLAAEIAGETHSFSFEVRNGQAKPKPIQPGRSTPVKAKRAASIGSPRTGGRRRGP